MKPTLPQYDPDAAERLVTLAAQQAEYRYDYDLLPPIPLAAEVPKADRPALAWLALVAERALVIGLNSAAVRKDSPRMDPNHPDHAHMREAVMGGGITAILDWMTQTVQAGGGPRRGTRRSDFTGLYQRIEAPPYVHDSADDRVFAFVRVGGPNPMMLHRIEAVPARFGVTQAQFAAVLPGDSLEAAGAQGRLFLCDYAVLDGLESGTVPHGQPKYAPACLGLFATPAEGDRALRPVAIQCGQAPDTPVITPADGVAWTAAKRAMNAADGNVHQAVVHLANTHLVAQAFAMATKRQLAPHHPLRVLIGPHFEGTLTINDAAQAALLAPDGGVDTVLAGTIEASRGVSGQAFTHFDFEAADPNVDLARRGLLDRGVLPQAPYRDDALAVYGAIAGWVGSYLRLYYPDDATVQADRELAAWAAEVGAQDGGRLTSFAPPKTVVALVEAVSRIVWLASAQHAAVNFPQLPVMSWALGYPLANFAPAPSPGADEAFLYEQAASLDVAEEQLQLGYLLGSLHYTRLGDYPRRWFGLEGWFQDERVAPLLAAFQAELERVEAGIDGKERGVLEYTVLKPSLIPRSINI